MAVFHVIGKSLFESEELFIKNYSGELEHFHKADASSMKDIVNFNKESLRVSDLKTLSIERNFDPIGIGKPLSIEIATVYTGEYKKFLGGRKDVVVVSGVKNSQTFQATSRAINIKAQNIDENDFLKFDAFSDGTKYVYYSPAMDAESMDVSFEIMFDNFETELFEKIAGLLNVAAGIPVFLPAASYLLGGSQLLSIGSRLGDALFSGRPNLSATIPIQFQSPIIPPTEPREFVVYNEKDKAEFADLQVSLVGKDIPQLRLVSKTSQLEYRGPAPYMIVLLNGAIKENLDAFAPTLASAAVLKKFYGSPDRAGEITNVLQDAMQLYNDSKYRSKGEKIKIQLDKLVKDSKEYKKLKMLYDAYSANIKNDNLKLKDVA